MMSYSYDLKYYVNLSITFKYFCEYSIKSLNYRYIKSLPTKLIFRSTKNFQNSFKYPV